MRAAQVHHKRQFLAVVGLIAIGAVCGLAQIRIDPQVLATADAEVLRRIGADPYNYFRLLNPEWTLRVCRAFAADRSLMPTAQLHGDAHIEQYALMGQAFGLDDFDDSARGPAVVDIVRFLGSLDLALRQRGWTASRDALFDRFLQGYRRGLANPSEPPSIPAIVRRLRTEPVRSREAFLTWGESLMIPMDDTVMRAVTETIDVFARAVRRERSDRPASHFRVRRAGWLQIGIGSAATPKILVRVEGPSAASGDDVLLEAKALGSLEGFGCLEPGGPQPSLRVIVGSRQIGRLKHDILAAATALPLPVIGGRRDEARDWWIRSWDRTYREVELSEYRSVAELSAVVYDSGLQLGAGSARGLAGPAAAAFRNRSLSLLDALESRIRTLAITLVDELYQGWNEFRNSRR